METCAALYTGWIADAVAEESAETEEEPIAVCSVDPVTADVKAL